MCCLPTPRRISSQLEAQFYTTLDQCSNSATIGLRWAMFTRWSVWCHGSVIRWCSSPSPCSSASSSRTKYRSSLASGSTDRSNPAPVHNPSTGQTQDIHTFKEHPGKVFFFFKYILYIFSMNCCMISWRSQTLTDMCLQFLVVLAQVTDIPLMCVLYLTDLNIWMTEWDWCWFVIRIIFCYIQPT